MSENIMSALRHPAVKGTLKTVRLIKRIQRSEDPYAVLDEVFRDAPEDVKRVAKSVLDVAHAVAKNPRQDPEEVAKQIAVALNLPEDQVQDFIDTVLPLAELIADTLMKESKKEEKSVVEEKSAEEKFITSENTNM